MKISVFGSPHEHCGISEYGRALNEAFEALGVEIEPHSVRDMTALVHAKDNVLVHYEPALAAGTFYRVLTNVRRRGARTIVCCHYFDDQVAQRLGPGAFKIVVHRDYGVASPILEQIPLGCPIYDYEGRHNERAQAFGSLVAKHPELGSEEQPLVITTCGFVGEWKRFPETVDAMIRILPDNTWLQMLCSPHFIRNEKEEQRLREAAAKHERVILNDTFLPEIELLDRLALSDLGFVYHGQNTHSVSAATKAFIAARCPFVVTDSTHASDVNGAFHASRDLGKFSQYVVNVSKDFARLREAKAEIQTEYERLNMIEVASKYLDLFEVP